MTGPRAYDVGIPRKGSASAFGASGVPVAAMVDCVSHGIRCRRPNLTR